MENLILKKLEILESKLDVLALIISDLLMLTEEEEEVDEHVSDNQ